MHLTRLYHTLKPLRWQQYWYRLWHPLKRRFFGGIKTDEDAIAAALEQPIIPLFELPVFDHYDPAKRAFTLLNIRQEFPTAIDWNYDRHGMLWLYHLNYFGWMGDESIPIADRLKTLQEYPSGDYPDLLSDLKVGLAPYPVSIRGMVLIRFCLKHGIRERWLAEELCDHYGFLYHFPEYHLQGNHLGQNGCSLVCAGYYFKSQPFYKKGKEILLQALQEQVLKDGGHIEGSPMYHSLLLSSLLQCIEIGDALKSDMNDGLLLSMKSKASSMLGWLEAVTFNNGTWPQVNDSTNGMAPSTNDLVEYAQTLNIERRETTLRDSGYRMYRKERFELFVNAGSIQPAWQPGHAHAHELSFCLNIDNQPVIVDPGIHTYENNGARHWERSTDAHNTLSVKNINSSDVWKSFRVGKKARVKLLTDEPNRLCAAHNGYQFYYRRNFSIADETITLEDFTENVRQEVILNFHFAPNIVLKKCGDYGFLAGNLHLMFNYYTSAHIETYNFSEGFNQQIPAQRLSVKTNNHTITTLHILNAD